MIKLKASEAVAELAEVMGLTLKVHSRRPDAWYKEGEDHWTFLVAETAPCGYHADEMFSPLTDANHRDMVLEACGYRWFVMDKSSSGKFRVSMRSSNEMDWQESGSGMMHDANLLAFVEHKSLNYAVAQAVLSAVRCVEVRIDG